MSKPLKNIIDLHGVKHEFVEEVLEKSLLGYHDTKGWEIITGNSETMVEIVEDFLVRHWFEYRREPHNYGKIILAH
jgi:hypothetical protein